ncbi:MAG: polysaccharide biosynthesis protein PslH, partial [Acidobacteriota bacterium]|nr:polysaccharide biosynthesis protein PslH [Acidobacteriota bacterium]
HNVESTLWQRQAQHEPNPLHRVAFRLEAAKMSAYERATVRRFHHVVAVSEHDRALMSGMIDPSRITVVPTGVDLSQYRATAQATEPSSGGDADAPLVVFLGSMDWEANIDGVEWFCREVWNDVLKAFPRARFRVVGRDPHARVRRLASASVEVTGTVPSVVEHLREATVFVVPLRVGGGTRLKIFEAMAVGKAVVSTTVGAEGLDVSDGRDVLLADDAASFAAAINSLLGDPVRRRELEREASALAARHDWSVVVRRFEDALEGAISFMRGTVGAEAALSSPQSA